LDRIQIIKSLCLLNINGANTHNSQEHFMVIDGHAHACGDFLTASNILKILDENDVDKVILVPGERNSTKNYSLPELARYFPDYDVVSITNRMTRIAISLSGTAEQVPEGNQFVRSLAQAYPDRIVQFLWVLLGKPEMLQELEAQYSEWSFKGIKLHQCWDRFTIRSEVFEKVARFAAKKDLPIFIHLNSYGEVKALIEFIERNPETKFIVGHLFGLELYLLSGKKMEDVYFEISNTYLVSTQRLNKAIEHFGAHKIIFGSDTPYGRNSLQLNMERVKTLPISEESKEMILGKNMQTLLKLG
jgi:uncharacterized protein